MRQNSIDNVPALNTGDDFYQFTTVIANLDIDIEDALESRAPGHRDVLRRGCAVTNR